LLEAHPGLQLVPVIDAEGKVAGAVLEEDMRRYQMSDFGPSLLANKSAMPTLDRLVKRCPVGEANATVDAIINSYVVTESACGMILVNEDRYAGYLANNALVRLAMEREVSVARESSPLTQLPGNHCINHDIASLLGSSGPATVAFFDFDHFKAFNDMYGFAAGDRALMLFADLLREVERRTGAFVGHVGGDDFFLSVKIDDTAAENIIGELTAKFAHDISSLYSASDRKRGGILSIDRFGEERFFPLLRASACILHLPAARAHISSEMLESQLAVGKRNAKKAASGISVNRLPEHGVDALRRQIVQSMCR
jgi:GGDEF domain-containing protein